jgi:hypothetical protein
MTTTNKIGIMVLLLSLIFLTMVVCQLGSSSSTSRQENQQLNHQNIRLRNLQKALDTIGTTGTPPASELPLQECEGDCDDDHQCDVGLVCFQRGQNQAVPGCSGGEADGSKG